MSLDKHIFDIWIPKTEHMSLGTHKFDFQKAKTAYTQACTNIYFARTYLRRCSLPLIVVCGAGGNGDSGKHASAGGVRETSRRRFLFYPIQQLSDWDIAGIICQLHRQPCSSCCIALRIPLVHPRDRQLSLHNGVQRPLFLLLLPTSLPLLIVHCCDDRRLLRLVMFREKPGEARPSTSGVVRNGHAARRRRCRVGEEARRRSSPSIQIRGVARER
ncbi:unnamed protein product [Triticum turgidum subsp. durum]|uniref:Uncharacterized protein n=1 Tax=Triticum turgidum subsp. durum TaxID=4567 RepID=A0A9R1A9N9_TRITD|nr:unnamed protein product [Triticum turgidum subsp. durum]